ncbi:hypothetical protein MPSEU_000416700 [Mayamaea pseudoterrestris]|nr:hypothetical protein MPSEU_000416700 [Mayamaea pseudoterrestris]
MTGAVLKNLLQTAVAYPTKSRRRYQPFSVYKKSTNELLLKSSSDLDFLLALLQHLADVGVDLSPLILPNRWQLRLIASDVQRVHAGNNDNFDSLDPTLFYSKLYNCLTSMATANYSIYEQQRKTNRTIGNRKRKERSRNDNGRYHRTLEDLLLRTLLDSTSVAPTPLATINDSTNATISQSPTLQPSVSLAPTMLKTVAPLNKDDASQAAQDASEAAQDAQSAAEDAQHSGNEQAAQAAAAAAEAAKKAANATHTQAAGMYQTALLNGDGSLMVQTIAQCFQNPRYGLAVTNTTAQAYVFFDGSYYYRVNLTTPYLQIVSVNTAMPSATHPSLIADADYSDYILALMVLMFSMVGFLLLLQQVMGRNYQVIRPLYKFQRFLFDPMHHANATTRDGMLLDDNDDSIRGGQQSQAANLMKNVIPLSMGGLQSSLPRVSKRKKKNDDASDSANDEWGLGAGDDGLDMEMVECPVRLHADSLSETDVSVNALSRSSSTSNLANGDISRRMFRDPDLVDLPTLASSSKVAMPVGFGNGSQTLEED